MSKFTELFLGGGGKPLAPTLATNFFTSRTFTAPQDGIVVIRAMGAGGGGARGTNATGGYSGSWGAKAIRVSKNDTIVVSVGAGGAGRTGSDGNGTAGGDTTVTVHGVTYTAYGGPAGIFNSGSAPPDGPAPSSNWDLGAISVKPGWIAAGATGGAGVDILAQGNNATTSDSVNASGGGGTGGPSTGSVGGGAVGTAAATGQAAANPGVFVDASGGDWGISFYGGSGGNSAPGPGGNGGGGGGSGTGAAGGNGGGGGASTTSGAAGVGGRGGGGGASLSNNSGAGGSGFAHLKFFADLGI